MDIDTTVDNPVSAEPMDIDTTVDTPVTAEKRIMRFNLRRRLRRSQPRIIE
jgi:hypothetical protein